MYIIQRSQKLRTDERDEIISAIVALKQRGYFTSNRVNKLSLSLSISAPTTASACYFYCFIYLFPTLIRKGGKGGRCLLDHRS